MRGERRKRREKASGVNRKTKEGNRNERKGREEKMIKVRSEKTAEVVDGRVFC